MHDGGALKGWGQVGQLDAALRHQGSSRRLAEQLVAQPLINLLPQSTFSPALPLAQGLWDPLGELEDQLQQPSVKQEPVSENGHAEEEPSPVSEKKAAAVQPEIKQEATISGEDKKGWGRHRERSYRKRSPSP